MHLGFGSPMATPSLHLAGEPSILQEGQTCWRVARADRAAFLIDGEEFFSAVAAALERARHQVILLGWDFHGRVRLRRRRGRTAPSDELLGLIRAVVARRPELRVHALGWGYGTVRAVARELLPRLQLGLHGLHQLDFRLDTSHPWLACHHQKIIAIDDAIAFSGGFDVTAYRWDSRSHRPDDVRRTTPEGQRYGPFHDVQLAVDGEAAAALGALARERWRRATGERLPAPKPDASAWPPGLRPSLQRAPVGIARTEPRFAGREAVREVEALFLASIAAARRWIYAENQYLTSRRVVDALAARLREPRGPEIVLVLPARCPAWLEETSMGPLRARSLVRLRASDVHGRLRAYFPRVGPDGCVNVHAKVMVVDDALARVGSANLSNRSLELDTECDLAIEARGRPDLERAIARFRDDLVAEHLGAAESDVADLLRARGSLIEAIEALRGGARTLEAAPAGREGWLVGLASRLADPGGAVAPPSVRSGSRRGRLAVAAALLLALALASLIPLV
jgi:phosphatidylserine/phosphatidylglycerophosphate/cardiolipin synthase-like enzyme